MMEWKHRDRILVYLEDEDEELTLFNWVTTVKRSQYRVGDIRSSYKILAGDGGIGRPDAITSAIAEELRMENVPIPDDIRVVDPDEEGVQVL